MLALSGCGSQTAADSDTDADVLAERARQVAAAWDGSAAAAASRDLYDPIGEEVRLPEGGLHGKADKQAYKDENFVLRGKLPDTAPKAGPVTWAWGKASSRPLMRASESYETLAGSRADEDARADGDSRVDREPHLTVTGAKLAEMRVTTSRGPATVPAWAFTLDGYTSPLKLAAAVPSKVPPAPIKPTHDIPGSPLNRLVGIAADSRSVTVIAVHGACDDGPVVDVLETSGSVVLSASVKNHEDGDNCTKQARMQQVTAKLKRPVGDRVLLDARTGQPVPYKGLRGISPSGS
ncbi:hypothetical protein [Streptomyces sp. NPDC055189]